MESIEEMRVVCVAHYVERRHTPAHADLIVPKDEEEMKSAFDAAMKEIFKGWK